MREHFFSSQGASSNPSEGLTPGASWTMDRRGRALVQDLLTRPVILCGIRSPFGRDLRSDGPPSRQKFPVRGARTRVAALRDGQNDADEGPRRYHASSLPEAESNDQGKQPCHGEESRSHRIEQHMLLQTFVSRKLLC
mmetsp:Transcript_9186/g.55783  ORF Transcript_9186/g.55783 Transcript_9186/m.55783 type:complete len:138 (-) Transcript_9186:3604-4017(-)